MRTLVWAGLFAALGCGSQIVAAEPQPVEAQQVFDVPYGDDEMQRLDIYLPPTAQTAAKRPAVLWLHGGGWSEGDKRQGANGISVLGKLLPERGFVAFACNYRLLPKHTWPAQLDDVQRAVRWIRAHADQYGVDPARIGVAGISAGAHLAAMLAVRETRAIEHDVLEKFSSRVNAAVALNGPTDMRPTAESTPILTAVAGRVTGGDAQLLADLSPISFVDKRSAPILFIVGDQDTLIPYRQSERMADRMKQGGAQAEVLVLPGAGHAIFPSITPRARDAILDFFARQIK